MLRRVDTLLWLLLLMLASRLIGMVWLPLADTSEPRYAEIARVMAESGDWITPWFEPGLPFWGKPPLAFWSEAASVSLLGLSDFAVRLPSWLATLGVLVLVHALAQAWFGQRVARWAVLVYGSMALTYVVAGAVLMDPFLTLGTTWAMTAVALAAREPRWYWRYGFFLGVAIGLLAKGPLALVLVVGPLLPWYLLHAEARTSLRSLPWLSGSSLLLLITLPWYVAAELKTPGFLHYFLVGEHFLRFVDPGWAGDLYGSAHERAHGTIWIYWLLSASPWSLIGLALIAQRLLRQRDMTWLPVILRDQRLVFLLGWSLVAPVFFTLAGNILWTYVLPALPAMAILLAVLIQPQAPVRSGIRAAGWSAGLLPVGLCVLVLAANLNPSLLKSEKALVEFVQRQDADATLIFAGQRPFSARYYSRGQAGLVDTEQVLSLLAAEPRPVYLAIPKRKLAAVRAALGNASRSIQPVYESRGYVLLAIPAASPVAVHDNDRRAAIPDQG